MLLFEKGVSVELFRSNHRTAHPSLEVRTRQMTTSTLRVIISTTTEYNNEMRFKEKKTTTTVYSDSPTQKKCGPRAKSESVTLKKSFPRV